MALLRRMLALASLCMSVALALVVSAGPALASTRSVTISSDGLSAKTLTIAPGTRVRWSNTDDERHRPRSYDHPGDADFDLGDLEPGGSASHRFTVEGTYRYRDERDRDDTSYQGSIVVTTDADRSSSGGAGGATSGGSTAGSTGAGASTTAPASAAVRIANRVFSPATVTIRAGGVVRWSNAEDRPHTVTASDRSFDSGIKNEGGSYSRTFPRAATVRYFCAVHPEMKGTVRVVTSAGTAPPPAATSRARTGAPSGEGSTSTGATKRSARTGERTVRILDFSYSPSRIAIEAGDRIVWTNAGAAPHSVTGDDGSFDSGILMTGKAYSRTFAVTGSIRYACSLHPQMTGVVEVRQRAPGASGSAGAPDPTPSGSVDAGGASSLRAEPRADPEPWFPVGAAGMALAVPIVVLALVGASVTLTAPLRFVRRRMLRRRKRP